jgi:hypothetical protein
VSRVEDMGLTERYFSEDKVQVTFKRNLKQQKTEISQDKAGPTMRGLIKVNLSLCLIIQPLYHEEMCGSGGIASLFLPSTPK